MKRLLFLFITPFLVFLAACSDDDDSSGNNPPTPQGQEIFRVVLDGTEYTSQSVDVEFFDDEFGSVLAFDGILDQAPDLDEFFSVMLIDVLEPGTYPSGSDISLNYDGEDFAYFSEDGTCTINIVQHNRSARFISITAQGFLVGGPLGNFSDTLVLNQGEFRVAY